MGLPPHPWRTHPQLGIAIAASWDTRNLWVVCAIGTGCPGPAGYGLSMSAVGIGARSLSQRRPRPTDSRPGTSVRYDDGTM